MAVRVDNSLRRIMRQRPGAVGIRVEGPPLKLAAAALASLRRQLLTVGSHPRWGPLLEREGIPPISYVSGVSQSRSGAALWFDAKDSPAELLDWTVDELVGHLRHMGVTDALVTSPPRSRLATSDRASLLEIPNVASLRLFPDPPVVRNGVPSPIPEAWLRMAFDWQESQIPQREGLTILDLLVDERVEAFDAESFLERARSRFAMQALVLAGEPSRMVAAIGGYFAASAAVCLSVAGPALDDGSLLEKAERLKQIARDLASQLSLAVLTVEPWLGRALGLFPPTPMSRDVPLAQPSAVYHLCDELVFDAYAWQILGPGHLRRLGQSPPGAVSLPAGRAEFAAGDLRDWLPGSERRDPALVAARQSLAPCLVTDRAAQDLFRSRWPVRPAGDGDQL
jgi:hypothetical protein